MDNVYVVTATFDFDSTAYKTEIIGVYSSQVGAFSALNSFDFMSTFKRVMADDVTVDEYTSKSIWSENGCANYSEQHFVQIPEGSYADELHGGSVTLMISERAVV